MRWLYEFFFKSSIGQKIIMSLTGLFLILFLTIHLAGNLQLLINDEGVAFNSYAYMMTHNPLIKVVSYGTYFFILLHAVQGIVLAFKNKSAGGGASRYAVKPKGTASMASKNMAILGTIILAFLIIHMGDFWFKMKMEWLGEVTVAGMDHQVQDLYGRVLEAYGNPLIVVVYFIGLIALAFHLRHGFQSAFQTLGLNHKKYTPTIHLLGNAYAVLVPVGFALIPIVLFCRSNGWI